MSILSKIDNLATRIAQQFKADVPVGSIMTFAGNGTPAGWLLCDGSAVSRTTYANLFSAIGTTYGAGDGSTTFNLPDTTNKFLEGDSTAGTVKAAGLPIINGDIRIRPVKGINAGNTVLSASGSFTFSSKSVSSSAYYIALGSGVIISEDSVELDASKSDPIYGNSSTVQPNSLTVCHYIKY